MLISKSFLNLFIMSMCLNYSFNAFSIEIEPEAKDTSCGLRLCEKKDRNLARIASAPRGFSRVCKMITAATVVGSGILGGAAAAGYLLSPQPTTSLSSSSALIAGNASLWNALSTAYPNASETVPTWTAATPTRESRIWCRLGSRSEFDDYLDQNRRLCQDLREDFVRAYYQKSSTKPDGLNPNSKGCMVYFLNEQLNLQFNTKNIRYVMYSVFQDGSETVEIPTSLIPALLRAGVEPGLLQSAPGYILYLQDKFFHANNGEIRGFIENLMGQERRARAPQRITETGQQRSQRLSREHRASKKTESWTTAARHIVGL